VKFSCDVKHAVTAQGNCINNDLKLSSNGIVYAINFALSSEEGILINTTSIVYRV